MRVCEGAKWKVVGKLGDKRQDSQPSPWDAHVQGWQLDKVLTLTPRKSANGTAAQRSATQVSCRCRRGHSVFHVCAQLHTDSHRQNEWRRPTFLLPFTPSLPPAAGACHPRCTSHECNGQMPCACQGATFRRLLL